MWVGAVGQQQAHHRQPVRPLRGGMEQGGLAADAMFIHQRRCIDGGTAGQQQPGAGETAIFRCHTAFSRPTACIPYTWTFSFGQLSKP